MKTPIVRIILSGSLFGSMVLFSPMAEAEMNPDEPEPGQIPEEAALPDAAPNFFPNEYEPGEPKPPMESPFTPQPYFPEIPQFLPDEPPVP